MVQSVLIIGEDPATIDFSAPDAPKGVTPEIIREGLNGSRDRLNAQGYEAHILWTRGDEAGAQTRAALSVRSYEVIVIGAGLRTLPKMAAQFETIIDVIISQAPQAKLAFNSKPSDSDAAALRHLSPAR
jgi:hypothetical protein